MKTASLFFIVAGIGMAMGVNLPAYTPASLSCNQNVWPLYDIDDGNNSYGMFVKNYAPGDTPQYTYFSFEEDDACMTMTYDMGSYTATISGSVYGGVPAQLHAVEYTCTAFGSPKTYLFGYSCSGTMQNNDNTALLTLDGQANAQMLQLTVQAYNGYQQGAAWFTHDDGASKSDFIFKIGCGPFCGDGNVNIELGEQCDGTEGCDANCNFELPPGATCGDGEPEDPEFCDDGMNGDDNDGCYDDCTGCGDLIVQEGKEECDGNVHPESGRDCQEDCTYPTPFCGDGYLDDDETCDFAADDAPAGCRADGEDACTFCGDGELNGGEQCDDDGPDCNAICRNPPKCGDGVIDEFCYIPTSYEEEFDQYNSGEHSLWFGPQKLSGTSDHHFIDHPALDRRFVWNQGDETVTLQGVVSTVFGSDTGALHCAFYYFNVRPGCDYPTTDNQCKMDQTDSYVVPVTVDGECSQDPDDIIQIVAKSPVSHPARFGINGADSKGGATLGASAWFWWGPNCWSSDDPANDPECYNGDINIQLPYSCEETCDDESDDCREDCTFCGDFNLDDGEACDTDAPWCIDCEIDPSNPEGGCPDYTKDTCYFDWIVSDAPTNNGGFVVPDNDNHPLHGASIDPLNSSFQFCVEGGLVSFSIATDGGPNCSVDMTCSVVGYNGEIPYGNNCEGTLTCDGTSEDITGKPRYTNPDMEFYCQEYATYVWCGTWFNFGDEGLFADIEWQISCPECGDGIEHAPEFCDDGNDDETDGCYSDCSGCGDGIEQSDYETCDSAITYDNYDCRNDCTYCGDGNLDDGEACEPADEHCTDDCTIEPNFPDECPDAFDECYNGWVINDAPENGGGFVVPSDYTHPLHGQSIDPAASTFEFCYEAPYTSLVAVAENGCTVSLVCTDGGQNGGVTWANDCTGSLTCPAMDGEPAIDVEITGKTLNGYELYCEERNDFYWCGTWFYYDGSNFGDVEWTPQCPGCGDGVVQPPEVCDGGPLLLDPNCNEFCAPTTQFPNCGNGETNEDEPCDPTDAQNPIPNCRSDCTYCGDGIVQEEPAEGDPEECDPNDDEGPACNSDCTIPDCPPGGFDPQICYDGWDTVNGNSDGGLYIRGMPGYGYTPGQIDSGVFNWCDDEGVLDLSVNFDGDCEATFTCTSTDYMLPQQSGNLYGGQVEGYGCSGEVFCPSWDAPVAIAGKGLGGPEGPQVTCWLQGHWKCSSWMTWGEGTMHGDIVWHPQCPVE